MGGSAKTALAVPAALFAILDRCLRARAATQHDSHRVRPRLSPWVTRPCQVTAPEGTVVTAAPAPPAGLPPAPQGLGLPVGALDVQIEGVTPGSLARITLALSQPADTLPQAGRRGMGPFRHRRGHRRSRCPPTASPSLDVRDGGRGDNDGLADGRIADPIALGDITSLTILTDALPFAGAERTVRSRGPAGRRSRRTGDLVDHPGTTPPGHRPRPELRRAVRNAQRPLCPERPGPS